MDEKKSRAVIAIEIFVLSFPIFCGISRFCGIKSVKNLPSSLLNSTVERGKNLPLGHLPTVEIYRYLKFLGGNAVLC